MPLLSPQAEIPVQELSCKYHTPASPPDYPHGQALAEYILSIPEAAPEFLFDIREGSKNTLFSSLHPYRCIPAEAQADPYSSGIRPALPLLLQILPECSEYPDSGIFYPQTVLLWTVLTLCHNKTAPHHPDSANDISVWTESHFL